MNITAILCTYNRCDVLPTALESLARSTFPGPAQWEVLVVDNNSNDRTRAVVEDFIRRYPGRFRYLFEGHPGKSYALNSGIREAHGDVLAFLDDDVTVEPIWLHNLTAPLADSQWAGSAGKIVLQWPPSLPNWLAVEGPYARHGFPAFDKGPTAKELVGPAFGANMAFRKAIFEKYGGFRTDLGPSTNGKIPTPGEDTELGRRVQAAGGRLRYEPSALVYHPIPADRIRKDRLLKWWFDQGRADALQLPIHPVREFVGICTGSLRWIASLKPSARFYYKLLVWQKAGRLVEFYRRRNARDEPQRQSVGLS